MYMLEVALQQESFLGMTIKYGNNQIVVYSDEFMNDLLGYEDLVMARVNMYPLIDTPLDWKVGFESI